jgi:hypothetical protein
MIKKIKTSKHLKLSYVIIVVAVVIAGALYAYHAFHKTKPIPTLNQYTKGEAGQPNSSSNSSEQSVNSPDNSKTGGASAALVAPTGNFVSNHHPNLSGSPAPNSMTSVCNTAPGASCKITFTNGDTTKSLPTQVTDAGGATYWSWKLQDIGLTAGDWTVSATSSAGSNSLSSTDPRTLVISQ